jgi:hypothetical protein
MKKKLLKKNYNPLKKVKQILHINSWFHLPCNMKNNSLEKIQYTMSFKLENIMSRFIMNVFKNFTDLIIFTRMSQQNVNETNPPKKWMRREKTNTKTKCIPLCQVLSLDFEWIHCSHITKCSGDVMNSPVHWTRTNEIAPTFCSSVTISNSKSTIEI